MHHNVVRASVMKREEQHERCEVSACGGGDGMRRRIALRMSPRSAACMLQLQACRRQAASTSRSGSARSHNGEA